MAPNNLEVSQQYPLLTKYWGGARNSLLISKEDPLASIFLFFFLLAVRFLSMRIYSLLLDFAFLTLIISCSYKERDDMLAGRLLSSNIVPFFRFFFVCFSLVAILLLFGRSFLWFFLVSFFSDLFLLVGSFFYVWRSSSSTICLYPNTYGILNLILRGNITIRRTLLVHWSFSPNTLSWTLTA